MKALSLSIEGRSCRFCQQCGKFHAVEDFDGANRYVVGVRCAVAGRRGVCLRGEKGRIRAPHHAAQTISHVPTARQPRPAPQPAVGTRCMPRTPPHSPSAASRASRRPCSVAGTAARRSWCAYINGRTCRRGACRPQARAGAAVEAGRCPPPRAPRTDGTAASPPTTTSLRRATRCVKKNRAESATLRTCACRGICWAPLVVGWRLATEVHQHRAAVAGTTVADPAHPLTD